VAKTADMQFISRVRDEPRRGPWGEEQRKLDSDVLENIKLFKLAGYGAK
jgi:hypothetical protein